MTSRVGDGGGGRMCDLLVGEIELPASSDATVDLPEPCGPMTPMVKKSDWSITIYNITVRRV